MTTPFHCCVKDILFNILYYPVGKIAKTQSEEVRFSYFGTQNTVPYCQKYTPTDYFFGDFTHWIAEVSKYFDTIGSLIETHLDVD